MSDEKQRIGAAAATDISLSQAILAPLDAIAQAQVHAARSFLNFVSQIGFPHEHGKAVKEEVAPEDGQRSSRAYEMEFEVDGPGAEVRKIRVPALALVPVQPLAVDDATVRFTFHVRELYRHRQIQESELGDQEAAFKRPWFLVDQPVDLRGTVAPPAQDASQTDTSSAVSIEIHVAKAPVPAALVKLLTALTEMSGEETTPRNPAQ
ncbi:MAG: DUF2589 domain-containing protein [Myxococcota bacterium]